MAYDIGPKITIKGEKEFNNEIDRINQNLRELGSELNAVSTQFDKNGNSQEALIQKSRVLEKQLDTQQQKYKLLSDQYKKQEKNLSSLRNEYEQLINSQSASEAEINKAENALRNQEKTMSKLRERMNSTQSAINKLNNELTQNSTKLDEIKAGTRDAATGLSKLEESADSASNGLGKIGDAVENSALMQAADQLSGIGDALMEVGGNAMDAAMDMADSQGVLQTNLGLTADEAEAMGEVVRNVFEYGVTDSVEDATNAVVLVKQNFEGLNDTDLTNLTNQLMTISDRTGTDIQDNVRGTSALMEAFGISAQEAMDLVTVGFQNNLNASGDFMDTLNEYSPLFAEAGYSAQDMLQILLNGMDNGAMNTDKVADAVKELQIRLGDGTFEAALSSFSDGTQQAFQAWKDGQGTFAEVAQSIKEDLQNMSPAEQQAALSTLATQFEDLGVDATLALFDIGTEFDNATGKAQEFSQQTPGEKWQSSLNKMKDSLADIGSKILTALQPIVDGIAKLMDLFGNLPEPVQNFIIILGGLVALLTTLAPIITAVIGVVSLAGTAVLGPIIGIIAGIAAAIAVVIAIVQNWGTITETVGNLLSTIWQTLQNVWNTVCNAIGTGINNVIQFFSNLGQKIWDAITGIIEYFVNLQIQSALIFWNIIQTVVEWAANLVAKGIEAASQFFSNVINFFKQLPGNIANFLRNIISNVVNWASNLVNNGRNAASNFLNNVVNFISQLPGRIAGFLSGVISTVASWAGNLINQGISAASGFVNSIASLFYSLPGRFAQWGRDMIQGLVNGITSMIGRVVSAVSNVASKIRSFLHFSVPDEGPLADADEYMPDFMKLLTSGLNRNEWRLDTPLNNISTKIKEAVNPEITQAATNIVDGGIIEVNINQPIKLDNKVLTNNVQKVITQQQKAKARARGTVL